MHARGIIAQAAMRLFAERGFDRVSVADIAISERSKSGRRIGLLVAVLPGSPGDAFGGGLGA